MRNLLLVIFFIQYFQIGYCQSPARFVKEIAEKYFGIDPVGKGIGDIVVSLKENSGVKIDTIIEGTDTSLFYLRGFTTTFYPFQIPKLKVEFQLREIIPRKNPDHSKQDTLFVMQILGIGDSSEKMMKAMIEETQQMHKDIRKKFDRYTFHSQLKKKDRPYQAYFYYREGDRLNTLRIAWGGHYNDRSAHTLSVDFFFTLK
jgi:hypothetical protein